MTLIIPPGFCNAAFVFTGDIGTQPYVTTLGVDSSLYGGDFVGLANGLMGEFAEAMAGRITQDLTLDRVTLAVGSDGPGGSVDSTNVPISMTLASTVGPTAMSLIARKSTNELGRRGRGRMFLPGTAIETGVNPDGSLTEGMIGDTNAALAALYEGLTDPAIMPFAAPPVLFHSQAPADPTPIEAFTVSTLVGWIRGRIR